MKICFFTENYYKGGLDTFFINLINAWPNRADQLTLMCNLSHPGLVNIISNIKRPVKFVKYSRVFTSKFFQNPTHSIISRFLITRFFIKFIYSFLYYPVLLPWYVFSLVIFFYRSDFDRLMIVNGGYPGSLLCRCAAISWKLAGKTSPAIFNFHSLAIKSLPIFEWIENIIDFFVVKSTSQIVSVSQASIDSLKIRKSFKGNINTSFIYNGINDPLIHFLNKKPITKNVKFKMKYCLMLATYTPYKGHSFILSAFKNLLIDFPDIKLYICGFGRDHEIEFVRNEVKRLMLSGKVFLRNFVSDPSQLIANARMVVLPSQSFESFGLVIIEAMAFSIPVVATDVGGISEVLAGSNAGYVCPRDDPMKFSEAMKIILLNPYLAEKLGKNGRHTFLRRYTASKMARKYKALLK